MLDRPSNYDSLPAILGARDSVVGSGIKVQAEMLACYKDNFILPAILISNI
jgi:hypothetical protein